MTDLIIITLLIVAIGVTVLQLNKSDKKTDKKSGGGGISSPADKQDLK